jgi:hypothetical protein
MVRIIAILILLSAAPTFTQSEGYEITIYNQNLGLVKDTRTMSFSKGRNWLNFTDVASTIDATSVHFKSLTDPKGLAVLEQNYAYDLVNSQKLLEKYLGKKIRLRQRTGNETRMLEGTLLSTQGGMVLQTPEQILINPPGDVELPELPEGLITQPTLQWLVESDRTGNQKVELSYLASGLSWQSDYVCVVNKDDTSLDITGWVTLNNTSGASYKNAKLKLIAGDIHRVDQQIRYKGLTGRGMAEEKDQSFVEKAFFEYHQYTLQRTTDILNNQQKQVELLSAANVAAKKLFVFAPGNFYYWSEGTQKPKVAVQMEFQNAKTNNMGIPLPKGKVRLYKADATGSLQFLGEDQIDHTPKDEKVRITLGNAFDVVGEHIIKNRKNLPGNVMEMDVEIRLRNHKDSDIVVTCVDKHWGDWTVLNSSQLGVKKDANTLEFQVPVKRDGEAVVSYRIRYTW